MDHRQIGLWLNDTCLKRSSGGCWRVPLPECLRQNPGDAGMSDLGWRSRHYLVGVFRMAPLDRTLSLSHEGVPGRMIKAVWNCLELVGTSCFLLGSGAHRLDFFKIRWNLLNAVLVVPHGLESTLPTHSRR